MFSALLFAQDRVGSRTIERVALESQEACIYKTMHAFLSPYELTRLLNTFKPDIERFLEGPVSAVFQNDYHCVRRAIQEGRLVGRRSELGKSFAAFAERVKAGFRTTVGPPGSSLSFLGSLMSR